MGDSNTCYVCGGGYHEPTPYHVFWSVEQAAAYFEKESQGGSFPSMSAVETHDPREAVYA